MFHDFFPPKLPTPSFPFRQRLRLHIPRPHAHICAHYAASSRTHIPNKSRKLPPSHGSRQFRRPCRLLTTRVPCVSFQILQGVLIRQTNLKGRPETMPCVMATRKRFERQQYDCPQTPWYWVSLDRRISTNKLSRNSYSRERTRC